MPHNACTYKSRFEGISSLISAGLCVRMQPDDKVTERPLQPMQTEPSRKFSFYHIHGGIG